MRAVIQDLHSPDSELDEFAPSDPGEVRLLIQAMVGSTESPGADTFNIQVCTPRVLERRVREEGPLCGRFLMIIGEWDYPSVAAFLTHAFESQEASDWDQLGARLGRIGRWEFEDYVESRESWEVPPGVGAVVRAMRGVDVSPPDPEDFRVPVEVTVAAVKGAGEGTFRVEVCTPSALARRVRSEGILLGEHLLIVERWDRTATAAALTRMFQSQDGADWPELADRLARYGRPSSKID